MQRLTIGVRLNVTEHVSTCLFFIPASCLSEGLQTLLAAFFTHIFQTLSQYQSLCFPSLRPHSSVFPPCLQPRNKPKQNYQRSYGLGTKCWVC